MEQLTAETLLHEYFDDWVQLYKAGVIRDVTLQKYRMAHEWLRQLAPSLRLADLSPRNYQALIDAYGKTHERQTVIDFNNHVKACIMDAIDEGLIDKNPVRKVVIKAKPAKERRKKYLSEGELKKLIKQLDLTGETDDVNNEDLLILLLAKTGMRYAEGLGITPRDFDFDAHTLTISKTWNYKLAPYGFQQTKTRASVRKITLDHATAALFKAKINGKEPGEPIFIKPGHRKHGSTLNMRLQRHCKSAGIPEVTPHALRHTHASVLLYNGVSTLSVSKRLGHSDVGITQSVYLHIIDEMENKDGDTIAAVMRGLG